MASIAAGQVVDMLAAENARLDAKIKNICRGYQVRKGVTSRRLMQINIFEPGA